MSIFMSGCSYTWAVTKQESPTTATGTQAFGCPAGSEIQVNFYENAKKYSEGITLCEYRIPAQAALSTVGYENLGSGSTASVQLAMSVEGITAKSLKGPKILCGVAAGGTTTAKYTGAVNLTAKSGGVQTGLSIG